MVSEVGQGRFEFGPYTDPQRGNGYRLAYIPGPEGSLELLRVSASRSEVIARNDKPLKLEDKRPHTIQWTRNEGGRMQVSLDGKQLLRVNDRMLTGAFEGFKMVNQGGDYGVQDIKISGVKK